jgi:hypothetical protein
MLVWLVHTGCWWREEPVSSTSNHPSDIASESEWTTWTCTGDPCPWGESVSNHAVAWPASVAPVPTRLGYTASPAAYIPASEIEGATISIEFGSAAVYAGEPQAPSHRFLAAISPGQSYQVAGLDEDEVLSVQADGAFGYRVVPRSSQGLDAGTSTDAGAAPDSAPSDDAGTSPDAPTSDAAATPDDPASASQTAMWTCTGDPCPWGESLSGQTLVWEAAEAIGIRLGYSVSPRVYLPATRANGATIVIASGTAGAYAGAPGDDSHRLLAALGAGQSFQVTGLASDEVLSVQSDTPFTYHATLPPPGETNPDDDPGEVIPSTQAFWRCNTPDCSGPDWTGAVIAWPASAAYQSNSRSGDQSRSVFSADGTPLYPYMRDWAQGCKVTAESGTVLIIEWQRGTDVWRETWLEPRQSHVINLVPPEDGAMIETFEGSPGFSVSLKDCTPPP